MRKLVKFFSLTRVFSLLMVYTCMILMQTRNCNWLKVQHGEELFFVIVVMIAGKKMVLTMNIIKSKSLQKAFILDSKICLKRLLYEQAPRQHEIRIIHFDLNVDRWHLEIGTYVQTRCPKLYEKLKFRKPWGSVQI